MSESALKQACLYLSIFPVSCSPSVWSYQTKTGSILGESSFTVNFFIFKSNILLTFSSTGSNSFFFLFIFIYLGSVCCILWSELRKKNPHHPSYTVLFCKMNIYSFFLNCLNTSLFRIYLFSVVTGFLHNS